MFLTFIIFCYFLTEGQIDYVLPLRVGFSYLSLVLLSFSFFFFAIHYFTSIRITEGKGRNSNIYCDKNSLALTQLLETIFNWKSIGEIL